MSLDNNLIPGKPMYNIRCKYMVGKEVEWVDQILGRFKKGHKTKYCLKREIYLNKLTWEHDFVDCFNCSFYQVDRGR